MMAHWSNSFVGIPHVEHGRDRAGVDCWGLVRLTFGEVHGIWLPSYAGDYAGTDEVAEISGLINGAKESGIWARVEGLAMAFDVPVFLRGQYDAHLGVVVSDGLMLHMAEGAHSCLEHYRTGRWGHRHVGTYRHVELAARLAR